MHRFAPPLFPASARRTGAFFNYGSCKPMAPLPQVKLRFLQNFPYFRIFISANLRSCLSSTRAVSKAQYRSEDGKNLPISHRRSYFDQLLFLGPFRSTSARSIDALRPKRFDSASGNARMVEILSTPVRWIFDSSLDWSDSLLRFVRLRFDDRRKTDLR